MFERSFFGFSSRLSSFLHVDDAKTPRTTKAHTSRVSGPQKERDNKRERERDYTQRALSPHKKQNVISSHTHARIPFPVAAPPLEKDGRRRFASATTCARSTRRLKVLLELKVFWVQKSRSGDEKRQFEIVVVVARTDDDDPQRRRRNNDDENDELTGKETGEYHHAGAIGYRGGASRDASSHRAGVGTV